MSDDCRPHRGHLETRSPGKEAGEDGAEPGVTPRAQVHQGSPGNPRGGGQVRRVALRRRQPSALRLGSQPLSVRCSSPSCGLGDRSPGKPAAAATRSVRAAPNRCPWGSQGTRRRCAPTRRGRLHTLPQVFLSLGSQFCSLQVPDPPA
uniref:Uncharacterized protein n=1 Tax=Myotis myotis TaxID=51298 RepID=A0A7J7R1A6_MYOMY|nr:hypothetical protein mMyoMyo1_011209 [Myotis myotis]